MKNTLVSAALFLCVLQITITPLIGQFREYLIEGRVVSSEGTPIAGVTIALQDKDSSRNYAFDCDKNGRYKIVGIPHGHYTVSFTKEGYKTISTDWDLSTPQQRIQKVKMDDAVMMSSAVIAKIEQNKAIKAITDSAKVKYEEKDYEGAIQLLKGVVAQYPDDINSAYLMGMAYIAQNDIDSALPIFSDIQKKAPEFPETYTQLGYCYQKKNQLPQALEYYLQSNSLKPKQFMVLYNIGMIYYLLEKPDLSIPILEQALSFSQAESDILETIAMCQIQLKEYNEATETLKKALEKTTDETKKATLQEMINSIQTSKQQEK